MGPLRQTLSLDRYVQVCRNLSAVQTLVGAAKTTYAMALLSAPSKLAPVVGALLAFAVYNANNLSDVDEDSLNQPGKARFVAQHQRTIAVVTGAATLLAFALAAGAGGLPAAVVVAVPVTTGVVYSTRWVPGPGPDRLKDVYVANTGVVAAAWAIFTAFLPVTLTGDVSVSATLAVAVYLFFRTFISVEVFNGRDVVGDRATGVATLPVELGVAGTQRALLVLEATSLAFLALAALVTTVSATAALAAIPVTGLSLVVILAMTRLPAWSAICLAKDAEYLVLGVAGLTVL